MAGGWARDGAVQDQIDDSVTDAVLLARARLSSGESATHCADCGEPIPERRRAAMPGVRTCVTCQTENDGARALSAINRRGSKDSQLR
ncbi:DksA/TraR family C4-type zinc finger protein [Sandaracinobacter neustonicus]|uniref:DksA/TraR family C4-type zinc finger protein n=1 Tax=Sandaracinobacter neustonicus TaxID=1715348 RepID=A0A501XDW2_9SPHN|nr:DksA/TraR family C4-type zinc finger protein [Sandaracinobacter neustonicus]TPE58464.1 DksA/TraR family C4-type zinc finger protein [Sandaracinobacter neustonicus]